MGDSKIDITSTAIEKGIDVVKSFVDKLILPAVEETGLLLKGKVTEWRFNREIGMLTKALHTCEVNKINPKTISLKLLCPILDYSGLEEDDLLHDKWAILLSNMVDSEQNIANHVFPYILSQLSKNEFVNLEQVYDEKLSRVEKLIEERDIYKKSLPKIIKKFQLEIAKLEISIEEIEKTGDKTRGYEKWKLDYQKKGIENKIAIVENRLVMFDYDCRLLEIIPDGLLENFEFSNVIRLGLVKEVKDFYANTKSLEIPTDSDHSRSHINVDIDIDVESETMYYLTELGELFFNACREKRFKK